MSEEIEYKIKVIPWHRWHGDYGWDYSNDSDHEYELSAYSIEELYEAIARDYNKWIVRAEEEAKHYPFDYKRMENRGIKYSSIYIEVEEYSEEKRNATEDYKQVGAVCDKFLADKKEREEKERIRVEAYRKKEQEERDRQEFERLKKKFT
jgi:hypothetical protein